MPRKRHIAKPTDVREQIYVGIDPGKKGAIAAIAQTHVNVYDFPKTYERAVHLFDKICNNRIVKMVGLERQQAFKGQGVTSMFSIGENYGFWLGLLIARGLPFWCIRPQEWKKGVVQPKAGKKASVIAAQRLFPKAQLHGPKGGAKDGRADALLIALCAKRFAE